jgi:hypothetical protein
VHRQPWPHGRGITLWRICLSVTSACPAPSVRGHVSSLPLRRTSARDRPPAPRAAQFVICRFAFIDTEKPIGSSPGAMPCPASLLRVIDAFLEGAHLLSLDPPHEGFSRPDGHVHERHPVPGASHWRGAYLGDGADLIRVCRRSRQVGRGYSSVSCHHAPPCGRCDVARRCGDTRDRRGRRLGDGHDRRARCARNAQRWR